MTVSIAFVSIESGITALGFRKMAALARSLHPATDIFFITVKDVSDAFSLIQRENRQGLLLAEEELERIGAHLAAYDLVCFSSMSMYAQATEQVMEAIRRTHPQVYLLWGGIHPIMYPDDAIRNVDAICVGEGESAFRVFLADFLRGADPTGTPGFWFNPGRSGDAIRRNPFLPLHTSTQMESFPFLQYSGEREWLYHTGTGFLPLTEREYLRFKSLTYHTVWSIGCPYGCIYCGNSKFIDNDPNYRKLRYPSPRYILDEVKAARQRFPFISMVIFNDDSFMAIPTAVLREFALLWKQELDLPFAIVGVIPSYVQEPKLRLLAWAGMIRLRMGIQSGSDRMLAFYKRPNKPGLILQAANRIHTLAPWMAPPSFDIILDNPLENRQDVVETLELLYRLPRPYFLIIYSLRVIPNTELEAAFSREGVSTEGISERSYSLVAPTLANLLVFILGVVRPPEWFFRRLLQRALPYHQPQPHYPWLIQLFRVLGLVRLTWHRLRFLEFSGMSGTLAHRLWRLGLMRWFHPHGRLPFDPEEDEETRR